MSLASLSYLWILVLVPLGVVCSFGIVLGILKNRHSFSRQPKVTFVVAVWNEGKRITKCVNSILSQNYPAEKIRIIVVGGGNEETVGECNKLADKKGIKFIHERERRGKWFALNTAIGHVKSDHVAFVDADCVLEKEWSKKMLSVDADMVISEFCSISETSLKGKFYAYILYMGPRIAEGLNPFLRSGEFTGIGSLVRSEVFKKIKFRNSFIEDWWFAEDVKKSGFSVAHSTAKVYEHAPENLNDLRKGLLRLSKGFVLEGIGMGNVSSVLMSVFYIIAGLSIPVNIYQIARGDAFATNTMILLIFSMMAFAAICALKYKNPRFILYSPMIIPLMVFAGIFSMEAMVKMSSGKEIRWEIYNKTGK